MQRRSTKLGGVVGLVAGASVMACGGAPNPTPASPTARAEFAVRLPSVDPCATPPEGSVDDVHTPLGHGTRFSVPEFSVNPGHGAREATIEVRGAAQPGPAAADGLTLDIAALRQETRGRLEAQGLALWARDGAGESSRIGLVVTRWGDVDRVLAALAAVLDEHHAAGSLWVSVSGTSCGNAA